MEEILKHCICRILKDAGYNAFEEKALEAFKESLERYLMAYLKTVVSITRHTNKSSTTLIDILTAIRNRVPAVQKSYKPVEYKEELERTKPEFDSPLASKIEKYIHIYDFMPVFPPIHTFKQTILKTNNKENRSFSVKNRLEQSLRSENNLLKLIKSSGSLPPFINYLYKK